MSQKNPYKAFYPMVQIKGFFSKLHKSRLVKSTKLITLNPIEGFLATFTCCKNIPHKPKDVVHLDEIQSVVFVKEKKLYHQADTFYLKVIATNKTLVFFDKDLEIILFMLSQIDTAQKFYAWLQSIVKLRYQSVESKPNSLVCKCQNDQSLVSIADKLIQSIIQLKLPVIDLGSFRAISPIDAKIRQSIFDYAMQEAAKFIEIDLRL